MTFFLFGELGPGAVVGHELLACSALVGGEFEFPGGFDAGDGFGFG